MSRTKGTPKTGGRKAGTPNKVTGTTKEFLASVIDENREQIKKDLKMLEPKDRLMVLEKFMQYVIPKKHEEENKDTIPSVVTIKYVGEDGDVVFPSREEDIDLTREVYQ